MKYVLAAFLLAGCATMNKAPGIYNISYEFTAYTEAYLNYKGIYLNDSTANYPIDVVFGETDFPSVGLCYRTSRHTATREIVINAAYWARVDDEARLELIFHELGHCDLNYEHQEVITGIMNSRLRQNYLTDDKIMRFFMEGL